MTAIDPAGETQPRLHIFTSAAGNYLSKVRMLCRLRARLLQLLQREGMAGVAHRLRSSPGG